MKVLAGELTETVYNMPERGCESKPLSIKSDTTHHADQVTYISDNIGLHRVHNPHPTHVAVSLHSMPPCVWLLNDLSADFLSQSTRHPMLPTLATISLTSRRVVRALFRKHKQTRRTLGVIPRLR
jgi:hypothetical protein